MKQVLVGERGSIVVCEVPRPGTSPGEVTIATEFSVISAGTESTARSTSGGAVALARKAISDPALRAKALDRVRSQGLRGTYEQAEARAARASPLGYSAAGRVIAVGQGVHGVTVGQRVAAAGSEHASHAEVISVPQLLVTPIPDGVLTEHAAYTTLGAIALHAHRLSRLALGESVAVVGLGVVGQLAAQIAAAAGCQVFGTDLKQWRCDRAQACVADGAFVSDIGALAAIIHEKASAGGVDAVLIAAGGADKTLANRCLALLRDRGRVVVVGAVPLALDRDIVYRKELEVTVSRSYGPGRYDTGYEERGIDYPIGYVRWTEGRNFAAVLALMATGRIDVGALTTATVPLDEAPRAYELASQADGQLGVVLEYARSQGQAAESVVVALPPAPSRVPVATTAPVRVALVGPGAFALSVLSPILKRSSDLTVTAVVARSPAQAQAAGTAMSAATVTTDIQPVLDDPAIDAIVIATRHDSHAALAERALNAGKHVFVEKPLGLTVAECEGAVRAAAAGKRLLMVDFNRRFSPHAVALQRELRSVAGAGLTAVYSVNAGALPAGHWLLDPARGGGRIAGEAVHFLDLLCWLFDADPTAVQACTAAVADPRNEVVCTLVFGRGRSATLVYNVHGSPRTSKERIEILGGGHSWVLDDYRSLHRDGKKVVGGKQQKGHAEALANFAAAVRGSGELGVTPLDGLRATRLALEVQGRVAATAVAPSEPEPLESPATNASSIAAARPK